MAKTRYPNESKFFLSINSFDNGVNTLADRSKTAIEYAYDIKNFSFYDGNLKQGVGFCDFISQLKSNNTSLKRDIDAIGSIEKVFHFYIYNKDTNSREDKLIIINHELTIYYISLFDENPELKSIRNITFTSIPVAKQYRLNGEDVMIFSSITDNMIVWNGKDLPYEVLDAPKISSMEIHYERLFVTVDGEKSAVWFSDDLDPTNWSINLDDAGFIELIDERGALLKVVSFCDYLYVFRENGISRISAYGDQKNFSVSNLYVSTGKIYENSVCVCGDKIIFLASDGLYKFDGLNTTKILNNISKNLAFQTNELVCSCYHNGSYYLACKYKFFDEDTPSHNNALLQIDINKYQIKNLCGNIEIKNLLSLKSDDFQGVLAVVRSINEQDFCLSLINNDGCYFGEPFNKTWTSPISNLNGIQHQKTLKKIFLDAENETILTIYHDNKTTEILCKNTTIKRVNIPLINFGFKLSSNQKDCNIKNLKFMFGSTNRRE